MCDQSPVLILLIATVSACFGFLIAALLKSASPPRRVRVRASDLERQEHWNGEK